MVGLFTTLGVFILIIYLNGLRVEVPVSYARYRGFRGRFPIKFFYVSNIPVIFAAALFGNIFFIGQLLFQRYNPTCSSTGLNFWLSLFPGCFVPTSSTNAQLVPSKGLAYYTFAPRSITVVLQDPIRAAVYMGIFVLACVFFAVTWVEVGGMDSETVAYEKNIPLKIVNFGNVMNELFKKRGKTVHRDHMRRQDLELQAKVQEQAAREIGKTGGKSALVVDTHMFVRTKDGIWPGTPRRVLDALDPGLIILIEADPEDIARRRNADRTRERDSKTVDEARTDLEWSRYMASANAVLAGAPIQIVLNPDGHQRRAAEDLLALIQKRTLQ